MTEHEINQPDWRQVHDEVEVLLRKKGLKWLDLTNEEKDKLLEEAHGKAFHDLNGMSVEEWSRGTENGKS